MSTYANSDPCTDIILDFIAGGLWGDRLGNPIGESNGNYNAYFGHVTGPYDFATYTLDRVYGFQSQMLKNDPRSTALGRYQFLRRTLQMLQAKHALPGSTLFTPELQDRFGVDLLIGRGYPAWWTGRLTDPEFAHNLSLEWASLPDPRNYGKSAYDREPGSLNHASVPLDKLGPDNDVYDMLSKARAVKPA